MARAKKSEVQDVEVAEGKDTITVFATLGRFVDLVKNVEIGPEPKEVELHPWLQAQIEAGLLVEVK